MKFAAKNVKCVMLQHVRFKIVKSSEDLPHGQNYFTS